MKSNTFYINQKVVDQYNNHAYSLFMLKDYYIIIETNISLYIYRIYINNFIINKNKYVMNI